MTSTLFESFSGSLYNCFAFENVIKVGRYLRFVSGITMSPSNLFIGIFIAAILLRDYISVSFVVYRISATTVVLSVAILV